MTENRLVQTKQDVPEKGHLEFTPPIDLVANSRFQLWGADEIATDLTAEMQAWYSHPLFHGMECHHRQLSEQLAATFFYPEADDLKQRFSALEVDPSPILEAVEYRYFYQLSGDSCARILRHALNEIREFVRCYEEEAAKKTDWKRMNIISRDELIHMQEAHELISGRSDSWSLEPAEKFNITYGNPFLMTEGQPVEAVRAGKHRGPYITLS